MLFKSFFKIKYVVFMSCIFFIFQTALSVTSISETRSLNTQDYRYSKLQSLLEKNICFQLNSFNKLMNNHGYIPNSWNGNNAEIYIEKGADRMIQPRMIQFILNLSIIGQKKSNILKNLPCGKGVNFDLEKYVRTISDDYSILVPWKYNHDFSDKVDEPMNIYDIGDWLTIVSILAKQENNQKITSYTADLALFSIKEFNKYSSKFDFPDAYNYDFKSIRNTSAEIGHLTLYLDGLLHSYSATKERDVLNFVKTKIDEIIFNNSDLLLEFYNPNINNNFSTMMTYGELSETILFLYYVTDDINYLHIAHNLLQEMTSNFAVNTKNSKVILSYKIPSSEGTCSEAMSLEASSYNALKLAKIMNDNEQTKIILSHLSSYYFNGTNSGLPIKKYCNDTNMNDDMLLIGHYYGLMKTLWFVERNNLKIKGVDSLDWLTEIISSLDLHKINYGYSNALSDHAKGVVNDPGGNVWIFNEGLVPIYYSLMNNQSEFDLEFTTANEYFAGCNFILLEKDNL